MSIVTSILPGGSNSHATTADEANALATDFIAGNGIVGSTTNTAGVAPSTGGFAVNAVGTPNMSVNVSAGIAYVIGTPTGGSSQTFRVKNSAVENVVISANSTGGTRYDWVYVKLDPDKLVNPASDASDVATLVTSRSTSAGSDTGSPPTYGYCIAVVTVANAASGISNGNISDRRTSTSLSSTGQSVATGWQTLNSVLAYGSNAGNREFTMTTSGDQTGVLSAGMRLSVTRPTAAPTQCMTFVSSSSQYATKSSPTGVTFTSTFTAEAWVFLTSLTGQPQTIIGRINNALSSGGWRFFVSSKGRVYADYGTSSTFTSIFSEESVQPGRWVHVAAVVSSVSGKTGQIYIDGTAVTTTVSGSATTLTQDSVDLRVGAASSTPTNTYFNGSMSEVRLWNTARSASDIRDNMAINLIGTETGLVALYKGSGNFNDATSNANNLTATNSPVATTADNPLSTTEYARIIKVSYSAPTTTITVSTGIGNTIPNTTLVTPQYSTAATPFRFPDTAASRVLARALLYDSTTTTSTSVVQLAGFAKTFTVPSDCREIRATLYVPRLQHNSGSNFGVIQLWVGAVSSGTRIADTAAYQGGLANSGGEVLASAVVAVTPGASTTITAGFYGTSSNTTNALGATEGPTYMLIERLG